MNNCLKSELGYYLFIYLSIKVKIYLFWPFQLVVGMGRLTGPLIRIWPGRDVELTESGWPVWPDESGSHGAGPGSLLTLRIMATRRWPGEFDRLGRFGPHIKK